MFLFKNWTHGNVDVAKIFPFHQIEMTLIDFLTHKTPQAGSPPFFGGLYLGRLMWKCVGPSKIWLIYCGYSLYETISHWLMLDLMFQ